MTVMHIGAASAGWGPQVWAAFLQAVLSAAAIFAAWLLHRLKHRQEIRQRSAVMVELLNQIAEVSTVAEEFALATLEKTHYVELDFAMLTTLREAIDSVPIHQVPLAPMCKPLVTARREARLLEENLRQIITRSAAGLAPHQHHVTSVAENRGMLVLAHAEAFAIHQKFRDGREPEVVLR